MLAMLGPGLGEDFEFDIRRCGRQSRPLAPILYRGRCVVVADDAHLLQFEREHAVPAQRGQRLVRKVQAYLVYGGVALSCHHGQGKQRLAVQRLHFFHCLHDILLNQLICQQSGSDARGRVRVNAGQGVKRTLVHRLARRQLATQRILHALERAAPDIVRHPRQKTHLNHAVIAGGQRAVHGGNLNNRVGKQFRTHLFEFLFVQGSVEGVHIQNAGILDVDVQVFQDPRAQRFTRRVCESLFHGNFNAMYRHNSIFLCSGPCRHLE